MQKSLVCLIAFLFVSIFAQSIQANDIKPQVVSHYEKALAMNVACQQNTIHHFQNNLNKYLNQLDQVDTKTAKKLKSRIAILQKKINRANFKIQHLNKKMDAMDAVAKKAVAVQAG